MRFSRFELRPEQRQLLDDGRPLEIGARALDLLLVLAGRAGQLVGKDTLLDLVWPDVVVEEANLHVQVSALRKLLGREAIATVPGRGYQFVLPLRTEGPAGPPAGVTTPGGNDAVAVPAAAPGLPPLLGRDTEFAQLQSLLAEPGLVTVTGAGGSGKTLLARHLMHALQPARPQGAAWVELLDVQAPDAVPGAVAMALGLPMDAPTPAALARALRGSDRLLVLDNAEHLLTAVAALVTALQEAAPELHLLVTSQAPLKLPGERRLVLRGLKVPAWPCDAEEARKTSAVALFVERARQVDRRFRLDAATVGDVVALCAALDGSALGVQLAASLLGLQPVAEVRRRLAPAAVDASGPPLAGALPDRLQPAENVLRAALAWSHGLLAEAPRRVFRRLAAAQGALPLPLACALARDDALDATAVADALADLVDRSLVAVEAEAAGPEAAAGSDAPRYRLLDAPRTVALEALHASGEAPALHARLAAEVRKLARAARQDRMRGQGPPIEVPGRGDWPAAADVRAALHWCLEHDLAAAAVIAQTATCHQMPAAERLACAARLAEGAGGQAPADAGEALLAAAVLTKHSDLGRRRDLMAQAAAQFARAGLDRDRYYALARAGEAAAVNRTPAQAAALLEEARALEDPAWPASLRQVLAAAEAARLSACGDAAAAVPAWRHALSLGREAGVAPMSVLVSLADAELTLGLSDDAAAHLQEAAEAALQRGLLADRFCFILANLTAARLMRGDLAGAREAAAEGWPQARRFDADAWWADHLALLAAREGRVHTAALLLGLADAAYARIRDGRQPLEARHADAAAAAVRQALGDARFATLRQAGGSAEREAQVQQAALAPKDTAWP